MPLAPYWKILIPGLVITAEGGSNFAASLMLGFLEGYMPYMPYIPPGFAPGVVMFFWIGLISIIVGIPILIVGLVRRSQYNSGNYYSLHK